jgi:putative DNA primase/helicase
MREDFWEFEPTHKLLLAANHKPGVRGTDIAIWRRIKMIPFTVTIPDSEKNPELPGKLKTELPGILAWAVRGCSQWQEQGLKHPEEVEKATQAYREEQDSVGLFIDDQCRLDPSASVQSGVLFDAYQKWAGDKIMSRIEFAERLEARDLARKRKANCVFWRGIELSDPLKHR